MDEAAVNKAMGRLHALKDAAAQLEQAGDMNTFHGRWYYFLVSANNIYVTLLQGAKGNTTSQTWFDVKKAERKTDPLMHWLHEARGDEEHARYGIGPSLKYTPGQTLVGVQQAGASRAFTVNLSNVPGQPRITTQSHDGLPVEIGRVPHKIELKLVRERKGRVVNPPTHHLGASIIDVSPAGVAALAVDYLTKLVEEARTLV